jgi:type II secretory pathway predicted ATPase ExeA
VDLSFNTTGPCIPGEHYMLPPERRLAEVLDIIERRRYFTLHAGRQTGKTTSLRWLAEHLNASGRYRAIRVDIESASNTDSPLRAFEAVLFCLDLAVKQYLPELVVHAAKARKLKPSRTFILRYLQDLAARSDRPLVVLFDEADSLIGRALVSFLIQLRQGYLERSDVPFPASVVLVGQRQVRDYVIRKEDHRAVAWLGTQSPFNIAAEAATLASFTGDDVRELLAQHTKATGQRFEPEAVARIFELGQGHPWITNALADEIVRRDVPDRSVPITAAHVDAAKETIIVARRSHIDSLIARLHEPRVQKILDPMLAGERTGHDVLDDDFSYVMGLGFIRKHAGRIDIANPIYREVIPRAITYVQQMQIANESAWYLRPDGSLDMAGLFKDWQSFWREDGHIAAEGFGYRESGPHLMLMAYLQKIVNGGGRIEREYGLGRGALDLLVEWKDKRHAIEVKLRRDTETEARALDQLARYLDRLGLTEGWLVLFDLRKELSWKDKLFLRDVEHRGKTIHVLGC